MAKQTKGDPRRVDRKKYLSADVVIHISVEREEWMKQYGDAIKRRGLVPEVTLVSALRKAAKEKLAELPLKTLEVK